MSDILFLAHRVPFPPDRGDKIRSHHLIKALAEIAPVHVGCLAETNADIAAERDLQALAASHFMPRRTKSDWLAGLEALRKREPVSLAAFRHPVLAQWVADTLRKHSVNCIFVFSGQMGQYVPREWPGRVIVDLVDVDSAKFEAYAAERAWPRRWIDAREGRLLRKVEEQLVERADHALLVSEAEAGLMRSRLPGRLAGRVSALGNGVDAALFDPAKVRPHPDLTTAGPHIVFTGQMDYAPNVEAARRAILRLMPGIRARHPEARFHVVGRAPVAELRALEGTNGARVWGAVADVRPFLAGADLVLAPLTIARGVQNKVLEAMAMARPVVLTPQAAIGIPAEDGVNLAIAHSDEALVERALALLASPPLARVMGHAARRVVLDRMSWPAALAPLAGLIAGETGQQGRRHAA